MADPNQETTASPVCEAHDHDRDYRALLAGVDKTFAAATSAGQRLFCTDAEGLFDAYLDGLPAERQIHTCSACRRFVRGFGGLVTVAEDGTATSALWDPERVPGFYRASVTAMRALVVRRRVSGPFLSKEAAWGTARTGDWMHLAVEAPAHLRFRDRLLTPGQAMAAKREDFATVAQALAEFGPDLLGQAVRLLEAEALSRSERFVGPIRWLLDLHARRAAAPSYAARENILWRAVASAPDGYCHPRSSMVGSLLEDIAAGLPAPDIQRRWAAKLHPLRYQRPQVAPASGNIAQAETIVEALGIAPSLERRFALLAEVVRHAIWTPSRTPERPAGGGVFSHLAPKGVGASASLDFQTPEVTWTKFARTALPGASELEMLVPEYGNFTAMLTAKHPAAPPILKWDREDSRNPVSTYVYHGGSPAQRWGLAPGWVPVEAVLPQPNLWGSKPTPFVGEGVVIVLRGCEDGKTGQGNALFPETLRNDLHGVRATIEAYSRRAEIGRVEGQKASGFGLGRRTSGVALRVKHPGGWTQYQIDRWD